jgi:hypothetical protein
VNPASTLVAVPAALVLLLGAAFSVGSDEAAGYTVDVDALPALAQVLLSDVEAVRAKTCPELPLVWLLAAVQAESTWTSASSQTRGSSGHALARIDSTSGSSSCASFGRASTFTV